MPRVLTAEYDLNALGPSSKCKITPVWSHRLIKPIVVKRETKAMERTAECHCGSLRAIVAGEPETVDLCHCKACQRRTGTAFHLGATYLKDRVRLEGAKHL